MRRWSSQVRSPPRRARDCPTRVSRPYLAPRSKTRRPVGRIAGARGPMALLEHYGGDAQAPLSSGDGCRDDATGDSPVCHRGDETCVASSPGRLFMPVDLHHDVAVRTDVTAVHPMAVEGHHDVTVLVQSDHTAISALRDELLHDDAVRRRGDGLAPGPHPRADVICHDV